MAEMSLEYGHLPIHAGGFRVDTWGAGPFIIHVDGRAHRFEDTDRFGPVKLRSDGSVALLQWPERSRFWVAFCAWRNDGRRLADDGKTCIWEEPKPSIARVNEGRITFLTTGDEDLAGVVDEAGRFIVPPSVGPNRPKNNDAMVVIEVRQKPAVP